MQCALLCETAGFKKIGNTDLVYGSSEWLQSSRTAPLFLFFLLGLGSGGSYSVCETLLQTLLRRRAVSTPT